jgi:TetR/AcrR family transcriptional regulator
MTRLPAKDQHETREAILRAAVELFAESGLNGASIAGIAKRAGVTKSLVMYYFPTKEELWREAVDFRIAPTMEIVERFMAGEEGIGLRELVETRILAHSQDPEICRMYAWTTLGHGNPIPEDKLHVVKALLDKVALEPTKYGVPPGVDSTMFVGVMMAAVDGWFVFRQTLALFADRQCDDEGSTDEFRRIITSLFFPEPKNASKE